MNIQELVENREGWIWPINDHGCWKCMKHYSTLPEEIVSYVSDRSTIVQAGGNCGYYTKQYAKLFNTVYTFEPEWLNFYCLTQNVTESNVIKTQGCLGDSPALVDLNISEKNRGKNFVSGVGKYPVHLIDNLNLSSCGLIHLDIEGYEYYALKGASNTIKKYKPIIVIEMWDKLTDRFTVDLNKTTTDFILSLGYTYKITLGGSDKVFLPI
jgi:FkbM family methyltransferase